MIWENSNVRNNYDSGSKTLKMLKSLNLHWLWIEANLNKTNTIPKLEMKTNINPKREMKASWHTTLHYDGKSKKNNYALRHE
jgi:hypothetical protein